MRLRRLIPLLILLVGSASSARATGGSTPVVSQIAVGYRHACALMTNGAVKCWGDNFYGQLGTGDTVGQVTPTDVPGLASGVVSITAGRYHTCALVAGVGVKCWGYNLSGQLGDGSLTDRWSPVSVVGLGSGVIAVEAGGSRTCAINAAGGARCWGGAYLGDGSSASNPAPVDVSGLTSEVQAISVGDLHACALTVGGGVKCWGDNSAGQIGDSTTTLRLSPVGATGLSTGVVAISARGQNTCALTATGGAKCWGTNALGQIGDGTILQRSSPTDVSGLTTGVAAIGLGNRHGCAVTTAGAVKCWGDNTNGEIGNGASGGTSLTPASVSGLSSVETVAGGRDFTCARSLYGSLRCWGLNANGQLGDGTSTSHPTPVQVSGLAFGATGVGAGRTHSCALTTAGGAACWGYSVYGALGDGTATPHYSAATVSGLSSGVAAVSVGEETSFAVTSSGGGACWGANEDGQCGSGSLGDRWTPVAVSGYATSGLRMVAPARYHTCAVTSAGGARCWGWNHDGVLGQGSSDYTRISVTPADVSGLTSGVASIAAGAFNSCAVTTGGGVKCWGAGSLGRIGDGAYLDRTSPVDVSGLTSGVKAVAIGFSHSCALSTAGGVKCWGYNDSGQLGDGSTVAHPTPADVVGLGTGVIDLSVGDTFSCVVMSWGVVRCWGLNSVGELGDGTTTSRLTPVDVVGLEGPAIKVAAGYGHACAVLLAGGSQCWGTNVGGQLGVGFASIMSTTPVTAIANGQTLSFTPPDSLQVGTPATLTATSSSGVPVVFDTWTPLNCTVSGNTVTATSLAPCGIRALQAGDATHMAAPAQTRLVQVYTGPPYLVSPASAFVAETTASLGATVTSDGAIPIATRGVVYAPTSVNPNPYPGGAGVVQKATKGTTGPFMRQVTGLLPNTNYSFRAYAYNITYGYSPVGTFRTASPEQINAFTASPVVVEPGAASTLSWSVVAGATATLNGSPVAAPSGSADVHPLVTTTYTLAATSAQGTSSRIVTVTVNDGTASLAAPSITAPDAAQAVIVTGVGLAWTAVGGAAGYDLRVLDASTGAVRFSGSLVGASSTSTLVTLGAGSYRFAVRACGSAFTAAQCGPWALRTFSVAPAAPASAPAVTFPAQGATLGSSTQTLSWSAVAPNPLLTDLSYEVLLTDVAAGITVLQISVPSPSTSTVFTMASSTQYELKVRACQAACGPWSTPVTFAVALPPIPTSPPSINACVVNGGNSLACDWSAATNADTYQVLVVQPSGGPGGSPLTVAATLVSTLNVTLPVPAGAATVLIAGCTGDGCGPSAQAAINAAGPNPATPNLGTPMAGTVVSGPTVLLTWNRIPGDAGSNTWYRLFVQDLSRQATAFDVFTKQNYYAGYFRAEGARYDALVIANAGLPAQVVGPASGFNVSGPSATSPTMVRPAHDSTVSAGNIQLGWSPVPGATLYEYYVAVQGQPDATVRGVTPGLLAQVPLAGSPGGIVYSGIVRACPWGATCVAGSEAGWGPWSNIGGPGVTNFTVVTPVP